MFNKFDRDELVYRRVNWWKGSYYLFGAAVIFFMVLNISARNDGKITEDNIMVILAEGNRFTSEKLISKIKEMHFQFAYIIYGQALLETDHFKSKLFIENNNVFGMKEATKRVNLSRGSQYDHAYYNNWLDSVYDYGLYYASYLSRLTNEEQYFSFLSEYYAEDPDYVVKLKEIIVHEKLKSLFN
jgi:hypothetical protein